MESKVVSLRPSPGRRVDSSGLPPTTIDGSASELHAVLLQAACAVSDLKGASDLEVEHVIELCSCIEAICADLRMLSLKRHL
jgi:hypothetical protein